MLFTPTLLLGVLAMLGPRVSAVPAPATPRPRTRECTADTCVATEYREVVNQHGVAPWRDYFYDEAHYTWHSQDIPSKDYLEDNGYYHNEDGDKFLDIRYQDGAKVTYVIPKKGICCLPDGGGNSERWHLVDNVWSK
jgi:hypothetical protein